MARPATGIRLGERYARSADRLAKSLSVEWLHDVVGHTGFPCCCDIIPLDSESIMRNGIVLSWLSARTSLSNCKPVMGSMFQSEMTIANGSLRKRCSAC